MKNKTFDSVKLMREIREKLSEKYLSDPQAEQSDMETIRRKYSIVEKIQSNKRMVV